MIFIVNDLNLCIDLSPIAPASCGRQCNSIHDSSERKVRDLSCFEYQTYLTVQLRRVECPFCGVKTELINWLKPYACITGRLHGYIKRLCSMLPINQVTNHLNLHRSTVKDIDETLLIREVLEPDYCNATHLVMDEFIFHKGHRSADASLVRFYGWEKEESAKV